MQLLTKIMRRARRIGYRVIRPLVQPRLTMQQIESDLKSLGVRSGGILLVHSSLSALGYVSGGAPTVIAALMAAIGPDGTLVLPTHSWRRMRAGCRDFDVQRTACCVGIIPETFRRMPGAVRSLHPTHSVAAMGPLADSLIAGHEHSRTPCGEGTPYARILDHDCQILLLGVGLISNTTFHTIEALLQVPYLMNTTVDQFTITDARRAPRKLNVSLHRAGVPRRFQAMEERLLNRRIARRGLVGRASSLLISGIAFRDEMYTALANEPGIFLEEQAEMQKCKKNQIS